ncbi:MAG: FMN-binding protein [Lachnospiraceae bacterium]|nr:FMN-binding protein [Lachnospiraceae bacterium]
MLLIVIGSVLIERFFCKYLCPLGAVFSLISRFRILKIKKPTEKCAGCTFCSKKCSMSIPLSEYEKICSGECINCMKCVDACPKNNATLEKIPAVSGVAAAAALMGVSYVSTIAEPMSSHTKIQSANDRMVVQSETARHKKGGLKGHHSQLIDEDDKFEKDDSDLKKYFQNEITEKGTESKTEESIENGVENGIENSTTGKFADGVYTGSGTGFRGTTKVQVVVENGAITDITVTSYADDHKFFSKAENGIISRILSTQSTDVDTVSGATFSSKGLIEAVSNALGTEFSYTN